MNTIFLFIKNILFVSDLLKSDYIQYLSRKYRVIIFSPSLDLSGELPFVSPNVSYVPWRVQKPGLFALFKRLRTNCLYGLKHLSGMEVYFNSVRFKRDKRARLLHLCSRPFAPLMTVDNFCRWESLLIPQSELFLEYCRRFSPALVITATPGIQVFDAEAIILAKKAGIKTLATNFSWDNLTAFKAVRLRKPDYLFVWNSEIKRQAVEIHGFNPDKVFVTGSMRFDRYFDPGFELVVSRDEFLKSKGLDPAHKTILFATAGSRGEFQLKLLRAILNWRNSGEIPYANVVVRLHPFDNSGDFFEFNALKDVAVEKANQKVFNVTDAAKNPSKNEGFINLKATLTYADVNINYKSTISLESLLLDQPVINFTDPNDPAQDGHYYNPDSYYYPLVREGAVRVGQGLDEVKEFLLRYLNDRTLDSGNRRRAADSFFEFKDNSSFKRNVDFISKILD